MKMIFRQKVLGAETAIEVDCKKCNTSNHPDDAFFCPFKGYGKGACLIDKEIDIAFKKEYSSSEYPSVLYSRSVVDVSKKEIREYVYEALPRNIVKEVVGGFLPKKR